MSTILDLSPSKARKYFLQDEIYNALGLPSYLNFQPIIDFVVKKVGRVPFKNILKIDKQMPSFYDNVNYKILVNKDGKFAYRPLQLANPYLYYLLVREMTMSSNWQYIKNRFSYFHDEHVEVSSIPIVVDKKKKSYKAATIRNWWSHLEQRSIELSMTYQYMFVTDITNCYGSIYTHTIDWALSGKIEAKEKKTTTIGHVIDTYMQGMQFGQTNGIPQGGPLFDFVAEMVLGYADKILVEKIMAKGINDYKILRYRDDYRIFSNKKDELDTIVLLLHGVLAELNFQMNSGKTKMTDKIVENAIKPDKLFYISNTPIYKQRRSQFDSFQKELYYIYNLSQQFPNSGIVCNLMTNINKRLSKKLYKKKTIKEDVRVLVALATEIAMYSPRTYQQSLAFISKLLDLMESDAKNEQIQLVYSKLSRLPNIGHIQVWMQRITYHFDVKLDRHPYDDPLCLIVEGKNTSLWNNDWIAPRFVEGFPYDKICDIEKRDALTPAIKEGEYDVFDYS